MTTHATDADFANAINTGKPVLIDFWATWCGPCRQVAPIVDQIANDHPEYTVIKVDVDQATQTALNYNIMGVPTLVILNSDGTPLSQTTGAANKQALLNTLASAH